MRGHCYRCLKTHLPLKKQCNSPSSEELANASVRGFPLYSFSRGLPGASSGAWQWPNVRQEALQQWLSRGRQKTAYVCDGGGLDSSVGRLLLGGLDTQYYLCLKLFSIHWGRSAQGSMMRPDQCTYVWRDGRAKQTHAQLDAADGRRRGL